MNRTEFIEKWRHELGGMLLDAISCGLHGPQAALMLRNAMRRIDEHLAAMHGDLQPTLEKPTNGTNGHTLPRIVGATR